jgi:hypothetical protein
MEFVMIYTLLDDLRSILADAGRGNLDNVQIKLHAVVRRVEERDREIRESIKRVHEVKPCVAA